MDKDLVPISLEEAELLSWISLRPCKMLRPRNRDKRTCHTKGKFLKFISAKSIASSLHTPPGAFTPDHFARRLRLGGATSAAMTAPTAPMLTTRVIVSFNGINEGRPQESKDKYKP